MKINLQQTIRAVILLAFFGLLFKLHVTDDLSKYINMKYAMLSKIAAVIFLVLFLIQLRRVWEPIEYDSLHENNHDNEHSHSCDAHCGHDHGFRRGFSWQALAAYGIILVPLITGTLLPAKTLDAAIAAKKGVLITKVSAEENDVTDVYSDPQTQPNVGENANDEQSLTESVESNEDITYFEDIYTDTLDEMIKLDVISLTEENFVRYADTIGFHPEKFVGKEIEVTGFIYKEEEMTEEQFVVSRFIITHCVADAGVIGFLTESTDAFQLEVDQWVKLKGTLDITDYGGSQLPIIRMSNWEKVSAPEDPYVYP